MESGQLFATKTSALNILINRVIKVGKILSYNTWSSIQGYGCMIGLFQRSQEHVGLLVRELGQYGFSYWSICRTGDED